MISAPLRVRLEHHQPDRLGIGESRPRVSWQLPESFPAPKQSAYRLEVTISSPSGSLKRTIHEVRSEEQVLVPWQGEALQSRDHVQVRVQVAAAEEWSDWSQPVHAEAGLLLAQDWIASAVGPAWAEEADGERRPPRVRTTFDVPEPVRQARLYLTAHGVAEAEINGVRVGDEVLTPGWTSYAHRLRYATFDVTELITSGGNAIGVQLADGWWRGRLGFGGGRRDIWGSDIAAIAQLEIVLHSGALMQVVTDPSWEASVGPILTSSLYDGESTDLRLADPDWSTAAASGEGWSAVRSQPIDPTVLIAPTGPAVKVVEQLAPVTITDRGSGRWIVDFGQNHSGRLRLQVPDADAGRTVSVRHSEVLQGDGELATEALRTAAAKDQLTLAGPAVTWEPRFTLHGYRYAEIGGWPGELTHDQIASQVVHTAFDRAGWFECSNSLINRLHENAVWGLRSNFVDVPVDCPQRDERLGWTGDIQVFAPAAAFMYDVTGMLSSWLQDLAVEQESMDWVPLWVPYFDLEPVASMPRGPSAVWGDAAVLIPDVLHERTGDVGLLRRQYASAVAWVDAVAAAAGPDRICRDSAQLGDWLDPAAPPEDPADGRTDRYLVATAYFAHSARRLSSIASALGEEADAARYGSLAEEVARAFAAHFLIGARATSDAQTAYALTTAFGLWPDEVTKRAGTARLAELIERAGWTIGTGFAGTPAVPDALVDGDQLDAAYRLLTNTDCPSWLYAVMMGATTVWERWDSLRPDGTINDPWMTSFNHYAFGAVADWLHRVVAGIAPAAPGYRRIRFAPRPGGGLTSARASHDTPYGRASITWELAADVLTARIVVPAGTSAEYQAPGGACLQVGPGAHEFVHTLATESRTSTT